MSDNEQDEIERIKNLIVESVAKGANRPRAIHAAGHAVVALHLGLPLESVNIEKLAGALVERMSLNSDEVRQLIGD
jgi:hypothetical protein